MIYDTKYQKERTKMVEIQIDKKNNLLLNAILPYTEDFSKVGNKYSDWIGYATKFTYFSHPLWLYTDIREKDNHYLILSISRTSDLPLDDLAYYSYRLELDKNLFSYKLKQTNTGGHWTDILDIKQTNGKTIQITSEESDSSKYYMRIFVRNDKERKVSIYSNYLNFGACFRHPGRVFKHKKYPPKNLFLAPILTRIEDERYL